MIMTEKSGRKFIYIGIIAAILVLLFLQRLFTPKYVDGVVEGALIAEYYEEKDKDFDVIFVGDCEVYENFSPNKLWQEYGINSYIRGSAEQYIWQSYYLLEDTCRYYKPKVAVFNIQSLQFGESQSEAYNRMSIEGMKWSKSKVGAIKASMKEDEDFVTYVFPILRYHTRWKDLTKEDFEYLFKKRRISHNGYFMRIDTKPAEGVPTGRPLTNYAFDDNAWKYLDMMVDLCKREDIQLLFIKAPSLYPYWYPEYDEQVVEYAAAKGIPYINFLKIQEETGIDYATDTYDAGLHMNLSGAEKLSHYIGRILSEDFKVPDRRDEDRLTAYWQQKQDEYNREIEQQKLKYNIN